MSDYVRIDPEQARIVGERRQMGHVSANNSSPRFYKDMFHEDVLGAKGEIAFATWSGLPADTVVRPYGDKGIDFRFTVGGRTLTVDVKAARTPFNLFVKEHEISRCADILVLARVEEDEVWFLGWEHKSMMLVAPRKDFGKDIVNYYRHYSELRPMWQLKKLLAGSAA